MKIQINGLDEIKEKTALLNAKLDEVNALRDEIANMVISGNIVPEYPEAAQ
ncbi:MAG: hypothetical protein FWF33_00620 [Clostridiales bacterium]|nr:hypothetical protein [Clostridiales bacterium]